MTTVVFAVPLSKIPSHASQMTLDRLKDVYIYIYIYIYI